MFQVSELFRENANLYEIKQIAREKGYDKEDIDKYVNAGAISNFTTTNEFFSLSASEDNNIIYLLHIINLEFIKQTFKKEKNKETNRKKMLSNYYNPYQGEIDISLTINDIEVKDWTETNRDFLDRKKSKYYNRNKSTIFKNMNARLADKIENDEKNINFDGIENIYFMTKRLQI